MRIAACAILLTLAIPAVGICADGGTITLRLEEPSIKNQAPAGDCINVPPVKQKIAPKPSVEAACAVVMDARSGQVLYSKNAHSRRANASTTKIMTAILLIENCKPDDIITASKAAAETPFTSIHLKPGERISMYDLLMGLMIRSANDAAVAAAEHISGDVGQFAALMNKKAREIGCTDTHFITPNGLYAPGHYSSAYDLCLMARYGFRYELFNEVCRTRKHVLESRDKNREDLAVFSQSKFLKDYPGADGVKSGYVKQARYCYVGSATRNGRRLVSAVLRSENAGRDTSIIMDYAFANYLSMTLAKSNEVIAQAPVKGGAERWVDAVTASEFAVAVPCIGARVTKMVDIEPVKAPIAKGRKLGTVTAYIDGRKVASADLVAAGNVDISIAAKAWIWMKPCGILLAVSMIGGRYGRAFTKGNGRRRRRFTSSLRDFNRYR